MKLHAPAWLCATTLAAVVLLACSDPGTGEADDGQKVLRRGVGEEPRTLNPWQAEQSGTFAVLVDLYEGLVSETADGTAVAAGAASWTVSEDGREYVFALRRDAAWSNGDPVTAHDFVRGLHTAASPDSQSPYAFLLAPIKDFDAVLGGELPADQLGVRAIDEYTLALTLEAPAPHFLSVLAMPIAFPAHSSDEPLRFREPSSFVGNGPYVLDRWIVGDRLRLVRNPAYRRAADVRIDVVEYYPNDNTIAELNNYRAGELDITATVPPEHFAALAEERPDELLTAPLLALYYFAFDLGDPALGDRRLRKALSMAIDRETTTALLGRGERPAWGVVPPGVAGHRPATYAWGAWSDERRQSEARRLYEQAGFGPDRPLSLKLTYDTGDVHEKVVLAVSSMWREVLGVEVELEKMEWQLYLARREDREAWQVMRFAWFGDYNDASTFLDIFRSDSPQNLPGYSSSEYDGLIDEASRTIEPERRVELMNRAEQVLIDDYAVAPVYFFVSKHLVSPRVEGFVPNVLDRNPTIGLDLVD